MNANRQAKETMVSSLVERVQAAKALIFSAYRGLTVSQMGDLRTQLRPTQSQVQVVKNKLAKLALKQSGVEGMEAHLTGPTAMAAANHDAAALAKALVEFAKANEAFQIKGGYMDGRALTAADIHALAKLPSREVLYAKMLGSLNAPASNMVGVLMGLPRKLVYAINAIKEQKQQQQ